MQTRCDMPTVDSAELLYRDRAFGGDTVGPQFFLGNTSLGRCPARNPNMPSAAFVAPCRPSADLWATGCGADSFYASAVHQLAHWTGKGFAVTSKLKDIKPEEWGATTREPRDPFASPGTCAPPPFLLYRICDTSTGASTLEGNCACPSTASLWLLQAVHAAGTSQV